MRNRKLALAQYSRVHCTMNPDALRALDEAADRLEISRSDAIQRAVIRWLESDVELLNSKCEGA